MPQKNAASRGRIMERISKLIFFVVEVLFSAIKRTPVAAIARQMRWLNKKTSPKKTTAVSIPKMLIEEIDTETATILYFKDGTKQTNPKLQMMQTNKVCNQ